MRGNPCGYPCAMVVVVVGEPFPLQSASLLLPKSLIPHRLPATDGRTDGRSQ